MRYPKSVIKINTPKNNDNINQCLHPTQKPAALFEYLIRTYTNEGNLVFDGFSGSGTTAVASINTNRNYICIEKEQKYFDLSIERVKQHQQQIKMAI